MLERHTFNALISLARAKLALMRIVIMIIMSVSSPGYKFWYRQSVNHM